MKSILVATLLALACTAAAALDLPRLVKPETLAAHRETLALSASQEAELARLLESAKAEAAPLEDTFRQEEASLGETLRAASPDSAAAETGFAKLLEAENELKRLQFKTLLALRAVLTAEQVEKAVELAKHDSRENAPLMAVIEGKAQRLRNAFDALGIKPAPALQSEGDRIRGLIDGGEFAAADAALDALGKEIGIDEPADEAVIDFSREAPGNTDLAALEARFRAVESAVREVVFLPRLRQLLQARDALEAAKAAEDAEGVGRVLTWAENLLGIATAP